MKDSLTLRILETILVHYQDAIFFDKEIQENHFAEEKLTTVRRILIRLVSEGLLDRQYKAYKIKAKSNANVTINNTPVKIFCKGVEFKFVQNKSGELIGVLFYK